MQPNAHPKGYMYANTTGHASQRYSIEISPIDSASHWLANDTRSQLKDKANSGDQRLRLGNTAPLTHCIVSTEHEIRE